MPPRKAPAPEAVNKYAEISGRATYLKAGADGDLLLHPVPCSAHVHEVHAELLHLPDERLTLLEPPLLPHAVRALLGPCRPICRADAHEERLVPPRTAHVRDEA